MSHIDQLLKRIKRLPVSANELGIGDELTLLKVSEEGGMQDPYLYEIVEGRISELETSLLRCPFIEPDPSAGLDAGRHHILNTAEGSPICVSFD